MLSLKFRRCPFRNGAKIIGKRLDYHDKPLDPRSAEQGYQKLQDNQSKIF